MKDGFHPLRVLETKAETKQATSVRFEAPPALAETFRWRAGQHVTVRFRLEGEEVRRPYSISEPPTSGAPLRITVKRARDGFVSKHINERLAAGDTVEVMPPFGGFTLDPEPQGRRTCYFFGAGSGITPLYAMLRALLAAEPHSVAHLVYGNVNADSIIFREELERLETAAGGRLTVQHVLSSPSWTSSFEYWRRGQIDAEAVADFIGEHPPYAQDAQYYICGPGGMNAGVRAALRGLDAPNARIHSESFGAPEAPDDSVAGVAAEAEVRLDGERLRAPVAAGQTLLQAVRAAGGSPAYSCESGVCGACRARLRGGEVHLRARMALSDEEIERGDILTCQSLPTTPEVSVDYDA